MTDASETPCAFCKVEAGVLVCVKDDDPRAWVTFSEHHQMLARLEAAVAESERLSAIASELLHGLQQLVQVLNGTEEQL